MLYIISAALAAYLIGSVSSAVIISKAVYGEDIREHGSGNAGATNMMRIHGKRRARQFCCATSQRGLYALRRQSCSRFTAVRRGRPYSLRDFCPIRAYFPCFLRLPRRQRGRNSGGGGLCDNAADGSAALRAVCRYRRRISLCFACFRSLCGAVSAARLFPERQGILCIRCLLLRANGIKAHSEFHPPA